MGKGKLIPLPFESLTPFLRLKFCNSNINNLFNSISFFNNPKHFFTQVKVEGSKVPTSSVSLEADKAIHFGCRMDYQCQYDGTSAITDQEEDLLHPEIPTCAQRRKVPL
ncbi:hypothetical protein J1N35_005142 [Gossypium stocksii]|uniref:Uncharacterized protein n=1 Tax=Gossypium stocksii TaxID=47602 RepID=A0A9D4AGR2_9ROSI|nr:hypothetical protein J1N35_005142 [Gossypium stocksii]